MNGLLFTNVLMCLSRAELGHLSGEGRWDKQEGTEGSYKVLVSTKMRRRKRVMLSMIIILKMMMITIIIMKMKTMKDKQEGTEGSYKVLVPTKMMMMMMRRRRRTRITLMTIIIVKMMMIRIIIMKMMTMTDKQKGLLQKSRPQQMLQLFHGTNKISLYIIIIYKKTYQTYFFAMS